MSEREHESWHPGVGSVLDIGGNIGALVLYADERFREMEIEISPLGDEGRRVHTAIHERRVGDRIVFAASTRTCRPASTGYGSTIRHSRIGPRSWAAR